MMADLPWGADTTTNFITNVGLITSNGPNGQNIMACEWTHHISYSPGLIVICIRGDKATAANIRVSKEFGVNLASIDQSGMSSVSGEYTGSEVNKIEALKELGFDFYEGEKISALMVKDAALNVECKFIKELDLGDHIMFVGEVLIAKNNPDKKPLGLHSGKYWKMTSPLEKPSQEERDKMKEIAEKNKK